MRRHLKIAQGTDFQKTGDKDMGNLTDNLIKGH